MIDTVDNFTLHPNLTYMRRALQRCKGFGLYFARCNTIALRTELVATLKEVLIAPIIELTLSPGNDIYIDAQMAALLENAPEDAIVFIYDIEKLFNIENRHVIEELNWRRGFYGRMNHPVVFWLPEFLLVELFNNASDFMDWRSGIYEFSLSQSEQQNLMNSTWQSANENFVGQLSLQEKERWIINLQNLLDELDKEESKKKGELLNRLGQLYDSLANYNQALLYYQQALKVQQNISDKEGECATINNIATNSLAKGNYNIALNYLKQSLEISQKIGNKLGESIILINISHIYKTKGELDIALRYLKKSLKIAQKIGNRVNEGAALNHLAMIFRIKGDNDLALIYLKKSLNIKCEIGDKQGESGVLNDLSQLYHDKGDYDRALSCLEQAVKISQEIGDKQVEGMALNNISQIHSDKGDYSTALRYLKQSLKIQQHIGDKVGECTTLFNIGHIHSQVNEQEQAMATWLQAYNIAKQIGLAQSLTALEKLAKQLGGDGLAYWEALNQAGVKTHEF